MAERTGTLKRGWKLVKFGDVVQQCKDKVDPEISDLERYIAGEHMDTDDLRIRRWGTIGDGYLGPAFHIRFCKGQVLYGSRRTYLRKVAVADFDGVCANTTFVLAPRNELLIPELLPFIMQSESFVRHSVEQSRGSVNPYVNFSDLTWYEFALPPLDEQQRIAKVLWAAESVLNSFLKLSVAVEQQIRATSNELLDLEHRAVAEDKRILTSLVGHLSIASGQIDPREPEYASLPLIAPNHIEPKTGRILELVSASEQKAISGKYYFDAGAVLYSKIRPNLRKAAIAPCAGLCSADMYPLIPKQTLLAEYLLEILLCEHFSRFAVSGSGRTGIPKLNRNHLARYKCHIPSIDVQRIRVQILRRFRSFQEEVAERVESAKDLKFSMLRKALEMKDEQLQRI